MKEKQKKNRTLMFGVALAIAGATVLMSGCSSNGTAKEEPNKKLTYEETLDYLKVDEEERKLVERVINSHEFQVYIMLDAEYQDLLKTMSKEEADKTEVGKRHFEMFSTLTSAMTIFDFSPNAMAAVLSRVGYERSEKTADGNSD